MFASRQMLKNRHLSDESNSFLLMLEAEATLGHRDCSQQYTEEPCLISFLISGCQTSQLGKAIDSETATPGQAAAKNNFIYITESILSSDSMLAPHHRSMSKEHTRDQMYRVFSKLSCRGLSSLPSSSGLFSIHIQMYFVLNTQNNATRFQNALLQKYPKIQRS